MCRQPYTYILVLRRSCTLRNHKQLQDNKVKQRVTKQYVIILNLMRFTYWTLIGRKNNGQYCKDKSPKSFSSPSLKSHQREFYSFSFPNSLESLLQSKFQGLPVGSNSPLLASMKHLLVLLIRSCLALPFALKCLIPIEARTRIYTQSLKLRQIRVVL